MQFPSLVETSNRVVASDAAVDWHIASHEEFWLITTGSAMMGHAGRLFSFEVGTLLLFRRGEARGFWNRSAATRLWVLKFEFSSAGGMEFGELLDLSAEERIIKLSANQQQLYCDIFLKIAFEKSTEQHPLNVVAAAAWLTIQLVNVKRWVDARRGNPVEGGAEVDLPCFELWQAIHRHARQPTAAKPMMLIKDPAYDSLRHRFQKFFGVSPRGLLVRLRMNRAKELLRTSNLSIKEIAQELGYSEQNAFTRAFSRFCRMSPNEWKCKADLL